MFPIRINTHIKNKPVIIGKEKNILIIWLMYIAIIRILKIHYFVYFILNKELHIKAVYYKIVVTISLFYFEVSFCHFLCTIKVFLGTYLIFCDTKLLQCFSHVVYFLIVIHKHTVNICNF